MRPLFDGDADNREEQHDKVTEDIIEELKRRNADEYDEFYEDSKFGLDYPVTTASSSTSTLDNGRTRGKFELKSPT